jgi:GntR family transcriptional regulator, transcriptional repressor for pyruvate dehydrogenase complex
MAKPGSFGFTPITTPRAFEQVCVLIRGLIASGELKTGDKLPPERELAAKMQVSRGVVREALRTLEIAGLVQLRKGGSGGAFIVAGQFRMVTHAFKDMVQSGNITLSDLTEARQRFMVDAIELACERATDSDFDAMDANLVRTEEAIRDKDIPARSACTAEFYRLIASASKNEVIVITIETMTTLLRSVYRRSTSRPELKLIESRRRIVKLLRARQAAKASREMVVYLSAVQQYLLSEGSTEVPARVGAPPLRQSESATLRSSQR